MRKRMSEAQRKAMFAAMAKRIVKASASERVPMNVAGSKAWNLETKLVDKLTKEDTTRWYRKRRGMISSAEKMLKLKTTQGHSIPKMPAKERKALDRRLRKVSRDHYG